MNEANVEQLAELLDRTMRAEKSLRRLARDSAVAKSPFEATERHRLEGKAEGVALAASYIREAMQDAEQLTAEAAS